MERSFIVDVNGNPKGMPGSGGFRDDNQRLTALYTNPRPYTESRHPQRIIVDNSACVRNEIKAQLISFGLDLAFDGIHYLRNQPSVRRAVDRGIEKAILSFDDWLWKKRKKKEYSQPQQPKTQTDEYRRDSCTYSKSQQGGYGSWREIEKERPRVSETNALAQDQPTYQRIAKKNDVVVISRFEYEALKRKRRFVIVKQDKEMGGDLNDSI